MSVKIREKETGAQTLSVSDYDVLLFWKFMGRTHRNDYMSNVNIKEWRFYSLQIIGS